MSTLEQLSRLPSLFNVTASQFTGSATTQEVVGADPKRVYLFVQPLTGGTMQWYPSDQPLLTTGLTTSTTTGGLELWLERHKSLVGKGITLTNITVGAKFNILSVSYMGG